MSQSIDREQSETSVSNPLENTLLGPNTLFETELVVSVETGPVVEPATTWHFASAVNLTSDRLARRTCAEFFLEPQEESGFVAFSEEYPGAVGQGETEEDAIKDLQEAISLLKEVLDEEEAHR